ncbi:MAG: HD domain-containing protein [Candidatus Dadabacteria bacterium]|nr:MAG: HD domain-containing protein [Candidatus Dadabacteria bacterium]
MSNNTEKILQDAKALLFEHTKSDSLRKHGIAVAAAMRWYADNFFKLPPEEAVWWEAAGLLHDFDYEEKPDPVPQEGHPWYGNKILKELGYPEEVCTAIMGHAEYTGVARETNMAKTLFAVDELTGLITASVLVRPDRDIRTLTVKSVKKKFKDKAFARGCNRDDIKRGAEELGIELSQHIENVIQGMCTVAEELGLAGK